MKGRLVILSGPSGVGKDTVINRWHECNSLVKRVVAYTTREPRPGEIEGLDYHFVIMNTFNQMAEDGDFLEHKIVHGNGYATPLKDMNKMLEEGLIAILKIDVQGALTVMDLRPDALSIFILPPSVEELEARLRGRKSDNEATIQKRLKNALGEIELAGKYHHQVVNDDVKRAVEEIDRLVMR